MNENAEDSLEDVFEEVLTELQQNKKDEAAMLQAEALAQSSNPDEVRKLYLQIRATKILKERASKREQAETEKLKTNLKREKAEEVVEIRKRFKVILGVFGSSLILMTILIISGVEVGWAVLISIFWFIHLPSLLNRIL